MFIFRYANPLVAVPGSLSRRGTYEINCFIYSNNFQDKSDPGQCESIEDPDTPNGTSSSPEPEPNPGQYREYRKK